MPLAESISHSLDGRRSGNGYRMRSVCHGGYGKNLYLADSPDGRLIATCFSHHCEYKDIMQTLEDQGLKPKDTFTPHQRQQFKVKKSRIDMMQTLWIELHILLQTLTDRLGDKRLNNDATYKKLHPEFVPMPDEFWDRELQAVTIIKRLLRDIYGI